MSGAKSNDGSTTTIDVTDLQLVQAAHDCVVQMPLSALQRESTNWEATVRVMSIGDVKVSSGGRRYQRVELCDTHSSTTAHAVMFGGVIESHGSLLEERQTYKIRDARVTSSQTLELIITERTLIRALPVEPITITNEFEAHTLVPFHRIALHQQGSSIDIGGAVVAHTAPNIARLVDSTGYTLEIALPRVVFRAAGVGHTLAVKRAHVSHVDGVTSVLSPAASDQFAFDPPALATIRAIDVAQSSQFKDINSVQEKTLAQIRSIAPGSVEHWCSVRIVAVAHDSLQSWSYEGCRATWKSTCSCCGAEKIRRFKLQLQVCDDGANDNMSIESHVVFGKVAEQLMQATVTEVLQSDTDDRFRKLINAHCMLKFKKSAQTLKLTITDAILW